MHASPQPRVIVWSYLNCTVECSATGVQQNHEMCGGLGAATSRIIVSYHICTNKMKSQTLPHIQTYRNNQPQRTCRIPLCRLGKMLNYMFCLRYIYTCTMSCVLLFCAHIQSAYEVRRRMGIRIHDS